MTTSRTTVAETHTAAGSRVNRLASRWANLLAKATAAKTMANTAIPAIGVTSIVTTPESRRGSL